MNNVVRVDFSGNKDKITSPVFRPGSRLVKRKDLSPIQIPFFINRLQIIFLVMLREFFLQMEQNNVAVNLMKDVNENFPWFSGLTSYQKVQMLESFVRGKRKI